jgi:hypothetical protein
MLPNLAWGAIVFKEILLLAFPNEHCFLHLEMGQGPVDRIPHSVSEEMTHELTEEQCLGQAS